MIDFALWWSDWSYCDFPSTQRVKMMRDEKGEEAAHGHSKQIPDTDPLQIAHPVDKYSTLQQQQLTQDDAEP